jgi:hypothetical protein
MAGNLDNIIQILKEDEDEEDYNRFRIQENKVYLVNILDRSVPNKEQKKRILDWLAKTVFHTVMKKGGHPGVVCDKDDRKPTRVFSSFKEYKEWGLKCILNYKKKLFHNYILSDFTLDVEAAYDDDCSIDTEIDLTQELFPFMMSDKDLPQDELCDMVNDLNIILIDIINEQLSTVKNNKMITRS